MSDEGADPLENLYEEAESKREQFTEAQKRLGEIKDELRGIVKELENEGIISGHEAGHLRNRITSGKYGEVREAIQRAREGHSIQLSFDGDDKQQFADAFADHWEKLVANVETIRNEVLKFDPYDREELVAVLYGKYSGLRKGDIRATLEAIDDVGSTSITPKTIARVLAAYNHDLNITDAREVLQAIQEEAENGGGDRV